MLCGDGAVRWLSKIGGCVWWLSLCREKEKSCFKLLVRSQPAASEVLFPANRDREQHCCNCNCNCNRSCTHHTGCICAVAPHSVIICTVRIHCSSALQVVLVWSCRSSVGPWTRFCSLVGQPCSVSSSGFGTLLRQTRCERRGNNNKPKKNPANPRLP